MRLVAAAAQGDTLGKNPGRSTGATGHGTQDAADDDTTSREPDLSLRRPASAPWDREPGKTAKAIEARNDCGRGLCGPCPGLPLGAQILSSIWRGRECPASPGQDKFCRAV